MIKLTIKQTFCSYNTEKGGSPMREWMGLPPPSLMKVSLKVRKNIDFLNQKVREIAGEVAPW